VQRCRRRRADGLAEHGGRDVGALLNRLAELLGRDVGESGGVEQVQRHGLGDRDAGSGDSGGERCLALLEGRESVAEGGRVVLERAGVVRVEGGELGHDLIDELLHGGEVVPDVLVELALGGLLVVAGDVGDVEHDGILVVRSGEEGAGPLVVPAAVLDDDVGLREGELYARRALERVRVL